MPIFEYRCEDCGKSFELMRSFKEADHTALCSFCKSDKTRRMLSRFFSHNQNPSSASSSNSCSGCMGGSCSTCRH